jgi:hypothetical protein
MKHRIALALISLCLAGSTAAFANYCINKDFANTGNVPANDIAILITGNQPATDLFNGFAPGPIGTSISAGIFSNFSSIFQGPNELLHWQNLNAGNQTINNGTFVHVGWCTPNPSNLVNVYWTDPNGNQLPGSVIQETGCEPNGLNLQWNNLFAANTNPAIVSNVRYALATTALPLDQLNAANTNLASQLQPLPGPASFEVAPGAKVTAPVPGAAAGRWIVVVYNVNGSGSGAATTDYVQFQFGTQ